MLEALALVHAVRRAPRPATSIAFIGADATLALRVLRGVAAPEEGGVAFLVEASRESLGDVAVRGWSVRGLGLLAEDWLADPAAARVDVIVAWRALEPRSDEARRALLDRVPRRAACFVALEAASAFEEGALTALWPAWHSCVIRERRLGWWGQLFEARAL
jgi:hypothetical protein